MPLTPSPGFARSSPLGEQLPPNSSPKGEVARAARRRGSTEIPSKGAAYSAAIACTASGRRELWYGRSPRMVARTITRRAGR